MPPVRFSVVRTRRRGRKLSDRDLHQQIPIIGAVECFMFEDPHRRRTVRIAKLTTLHDATRPELIPSLYDAQVTTLGPIGATIAGIERLPADDTVIEFAQARTGRFALRPRDRRTTERVGVQLRVCDQERPETRLGSRVHTRYRERCARLEECRRGIPRVVREFPKSGRVWPALG
jgi:hypothetical protein